MKRQVQSKFCIVSPLATIVHEAKGRAYSTYGKEDGVNKRIQQGNKMESGCKNLCYKT